MHKDWRYYTPAKDQGQCPVMRFGEWSIIFPGEVLLSHKDHDQELRASGLVPCNKPRIFKTIKALKRSRIHIGKVYKS